MGFSDQFKSLDLERMRRAVYEATSTQVERALEAQVPALQDIPALFSPAADPYLERMAQRAAALTERRFGKVIQLYAPLYLSNECLNHCTYCGFSRTNTIPRLTLTLDQVEQESQVLLDEGFRHVLVVSGEAPRAVGYHYLTSVLGLLRERFDSISFEIYPLDEDGYRRLGEQGVDSLTLYQETYDPALYARVHPRGPKRDFFWRLDAHDRAGRAQYRSLGIGALLGLGDWRLESVVLAVHGRYLTRRYWKSRVALSFPRLRSAIGGEKASQEVSDLYIVRMLCAMRLILPDAEMVMSTREQAEFRDNLIGLGITRMSAGSKTNPGGYTRQLSAAEQFAVEDRRSPAEVANVIKEKGYEPVWKDFDRQLRFLAPHGKTA